MSKETGTELAPVPSGPSLDPRSPPKPRILYLIDGLEGDGAERQLCELARAVKRHGMYEPHVGVLEETQGHAWMLEEAGVEIHPFLRKRRADISPLFKIIRFLRRQSISLVHTYMSMGGEFGLFAGKLCGLPVITSSIRNAKDRNWRERVRTRYQSYLADIAVANSRAGFTNRFSRMRSNFVVIPNGMDFARFEGIGEEVSRLRSELALPEGAAVLCMACRFQKHKDHVTLLHAAHQLAREGLDFVLLLPGDGEGRRQVEQLASELGIEKRLRFLGYRRRIEPVIAMSQVSILLTNTDIHMEGMSNTILESMALRVPVIATRGGGTDEVLIDGESCGIKVKPFDKGEVADAIKLILGDRERREAMVENAYRMVRARHNLGRYLDDNLRLYSRLLEQRVTSRSPPGDASSR